MPLWKDGGKATLAINSTATDFKLWSTHALKNYFAIRKKSIEGSHQDLAIRAFASYKNDVTVGINMEQAITRILRKPKIDLFKVPYSLSNKSGWIEEEQGIINWPAIFFHDIVKSNHLQILLTDCILNINRGKIYHYFACDFFQKVFYPKVSEFSQLCIKKTKVTHLQKISQKDYIV